MSLLNFSAVKLGSYDGYGTSAGYFDYSEMDYSELFRKYYGKPGTNTGLDTFTKNTSDTSDTYDTSVESNSVDKNGFQFTSVLTNRQKNELAKFKTIYNNNKSRYQAISDRIKAKTGKYIPPELIASLHYRESSCNFNTYLHNGQKLGRKTTLEPKGIFFNNFEDAAVDAILRVGVDEVINGDIDSYLKFAEKFNGFGYRKKGVASPYVWAGTTKYKGGMYVADHKYSAYAKDKRCGVAVLMNEIA